METTNGNVEGKMEDGR